MMGKAIAVVCLTLRVCIHTKNHFAHTFGGVVEWDLPVRAAGWIPNGILSTIPLDAAAAGQHGG